jgi:tetratricopeptide (TPR) repeat protein
MAYLADAEGTFEEHSLGGVPGEDLFLEHVHMTFKGNYLLARTLFDKIIRMEPRHLRLAPADAGPLLTEQQCAERLARTEWDEWVFGTKVYELLIQEPPFTFQLDHAERGQRVKEHLAALRARLQAGGYQQAVTVYQKAVQSGEADWLIRLRFGDLLSEGGNLADAKAQYEWAAAQLRHSFTAHFKAGDVCLKLNDPVGAEAHLRDALRLDPEHLEANVGLAGALEAQGKNAEALALFEEQVRKHPMRALALDALGRYLFRQGRLDEAKARFAAALEREPKNPGFHVDLGLVAEKQGNLDEAIKCIEAALQLQPEWPQMRDYLAELRKKRDAGKAGRR